MLVIVVIDVLPKSPVVPGPLTPVVKKNSSFPPMVFLTSNISPSLLFSNVQVTVSFGSGENPAADSPPCIEPLQTTPSFSHPASASSVML